MYDSDIDDEDFEGGDYIEQLNERLARAVYEKDIEACRALLAAGADPDGEAMLQDHTLLSNAIAHRFDEGIALLLAAGASVDADRAGAAVPLITASRYGDIETCRELLARGADVHARDSEECTALHRAANEGHLEICKILVQAGADLHAIDSYDHTPLHDVAYNRTRPTQMCDWLISVGASPSYTPPGASAPYLTPLQKAVNLGSKEMVRHLLMVHNEDPSQRTLAGDSLESLAQHHEDILQLVRVARVAKNVADATSTIDSSDAAPRQRSRGLSPL